MDITISLSPEIYLKLGSNVSKEGNYPTSRLQKGLILSSNGQELAEEGVGFGVPVLKLGVKTIFPGEFELTRLEEGPHQVIIGIFSLNLEERLTSQNLGNVKSKSLYRIKRHFEKMYRNLPPSRRPLMALSNALRSSLGWRTTFVDAGCNLEVRVGYDIDSETGLITVDVDTAGVTNSGVTEVILMNEQGANYFDTYSDSSGLLLKQEKIGSWDEVTAESATFLCHTHRLAFTLQQTNGARLFRGRELTGTRLAWSGFGYSLPPTSQRFTYTLRIDRLE